MVQSGRGKTIVRSEAGQEYTIKLPRSGSLTGFLKPGNRLIINERVLQGLEPGQSLRVGMPNAYTVIDNYESIISDARSASGSPLPPALSELTIRVVATGRTRDALLGDLEEKFVNDCRTVGVNRARWRYRAEVLQTALPVLRRTLGRIGGATLIGDLIHWWLGK